MESLSTLGLSVQARVPAQGPGCRGVTGPPGGASESTAREDRVAFAAALRQSFGAGALQSAPRVAPSKRSAEAQAVDEPTPDEGEARCAEEGAEGTTSALRPKKGKGARAPDETAAVAAQAPAPMPLDLTQEAATAEAASEPGRADAEDDLTIAALAPSAATHAANVPAAAMRTAADAVGAMSAAETEPMPAAAPHERPGRATQASDPAPEDTTASHDMAPASSGSEAEGVRADEEWRASPVSDTVPAHATPLVGDQLRREEIDQAGLFDAPNDADEARANGPDASRAATGQGDGGARHASGGAGQSAMDAPVRATPEEQTPSAASTASPGSGAIEAERPGRRQHGTPAAGAPEILPGDAHTTVVHWLHGSERVDDVQAQRQVQHILVSNLAEDIHRLTFVGQSRAVLQLQPPDLGKLSIHLTMQENGLAVEMVVETEAIRAIVESTLDQLQTALAQHGLATAGVFVQVGESAHRDGEEWQARRSREPRGVPAAAGRADGATTAAQGRHLGYDSTVDYRI